MNRIQQAILSLITLTIVAVLSGCVSGTAYQPLHERNDSGLVYFYRSYSFGGSGMYPVIKVNGERIVNLKAGGYSYVYLEPGSHTLSLFESAVLSPDAKEPYHEEKFTIEAGDTRYFRWSVSGDSVNQFYIDWTKYASFVNEAIGRLEIQDCKLIPPYNQSN